MLQIEKSKFVQTFLLRASGIVSQMKSYDDIVTDESVVSKLLRILTLKFDHVVATIEESKDLKT